MKRGLVAALTALLMSGAGNAPAQTLLGGHGPDAWAVVGVASNDVLNLRAGPSTRYPRISWLAHDARRVEMLVCVPTLTYQQHQAIEADGVKLPTRWCLMRQGARQGWANARFLREDSSAGLAMAASPTGEAPTSGPEAALRGKVEAFLGQWIAGDFLSDPSKLDFFVSPDLGVELRRPSRADRVFDAQDLDIGNMRVFWGTPPLYRGLATIEVTYENFGRPGLLEFSLRRLEGGGRFVIFDIRGPYSE